MRLGLLILGFTLPAVPLAAATSAPAIGGATVGITTHQGSAVRAQVRKIVQALCDGGPIPLGGGAPAGEIYIPNVRSRCLTVDNAGILGGNVPDDPGEGSAGVTMANPSPDGSLLATLYPGSFSLSGVELLDSACGQWSYGAALDPAAVQGTGSLTLWPAAAGAPQGVFAGTLPLAVRLHLENLDRGLAYDLPLKIDAALRGSWTAPPPANSVQAASNLSLYVWPLELWWIHHSGCWEKVADENGEILYCDRCVAQSAAPALSDLPPPS